jgi:hypothetical protein
VLAPVAGLLVDRLEARALLLVASLAQAALAAALAFALGRVAAILVLATLLGVGDRFRWPGCRRAAQCPYPCISLHRHTPTLELAVNGPNGPFGDQGVERPRRVAARADRASRRQRDASMWLAPKLSGLGRKSAPDCGEEL